MSNKEGPKTTQVVEHLEAALDAEGEAWKEAGMDPHNLKLNGPQLRAEIKTLFDIITTKGLATEEELTRMFQENLLQALKNVREEIEPQLRQQRRSHLAPMPLPVLVDSHGQRLL